MKTVVSKWIFKVKEAADGEKNYKTRFVARRFSQKYGEILVLFVKQSPIRSLLITAGHHEYIIYISRRNFYMVG